MWMQKIYPHDDDRSQTMDRGDINLKTRFITAGTSRYIYFITEKIANERIIEDGFHVFDLWAGTSSKYFVDGDSLITEFYEMAPGCGSAIVEDDVSFEFYRAQINHKEKRLEKGESIMTIVKSDVNMVEQGKQWKSTRNANGILLVMLTYVGLCVVEIRNNGWISYKDIECDNFGWLWCSPWQEHHMLYCLEYMHYQDTVVVTGHTLSVNHF